MHVKVLLPTTDLIPTFLQAPPALIAAFAGTRGRDREAMSTDERITNLFFMI